MSGVWCDSPKSSYFISNQQFLLGFLINCQKPLVFFVGLRQLNLQGILRVFVMNDTLTIEECRLYLKDTDLNDAQIMELRDNLCVLIDKTIDSHFSKKLQ